MISKYLLLCLFGVSAYFAVDTVGREAIIRGTLVRNAEQFPYQVSVQINGQDNICGGGIIGDYHVLTAARCVINISGHFENKSLSIVAGIDQVNYTQPQDLRVSVKKVLVPIEYNNRVDTSCDIAVLMLNNSLELGTHNRHLKKLNLPHHDEHGVYDDYAGKTVLIAGFGWNWYTFVRNIGGSDGQLRFAEAIVLSSDMEGYQWNTNIVKQICAKIKQPDHSESTKSRGICQHDFGSPLVYNEIAIGVASRYSTFPRRCSEKNIGAVYTRVSAFRKFIDDAMNYDHNKHHLGIRTLEISL